MNTAKKPERVYTYADYLTWPEEESWELIEGVPYDMSPAPGIKHQSISSNLHGAIWNYLKGKPCKVFAAPIDVIFPHNHREKDENVTTVVQPDIIVVCDSSKLTPTHCKGAPDLIIEILSPSTASKDMKQKRDLYEKNGVKEYWIVDPSNMTVQIYEFINEQYGKPDTYGAADMIQVGIFEDLKMNMVEVFEVEITEEVEPRVEF